MSTTSLYFLTILLAGIVTLGLLPVLHKLFGSFLLDTPNSLKRHSYAVPLIGGCAILCGLAASLIFIRLTTNFPTGTLHSLRGILYGASIIFVLGIVDDCLKPKGLSVVIKLAIQGLATACLLVYGVHITLFDSLELSYPLTILWVIGLTNAFNLLDISDGLCVSQAVACAAGLWLIALPSEQIYVNFCACALLGACLGFWPYNHSKRFKTFLGDSGSTLIGFTLAALAMGTGYSQHSNWGFLAPLLIFAIPIFDTSFVVFARISKLQNPLRGSNDHAALRLKQIGFTSRQVLLLFLGIGILFNVMAFGVTQLSAEGAVFLYSIAVIFFFTAAVYLSRIRISE